MNRTIKLGLSFLSALFVLLVAGVAFAADGAADNEFTMKAFIGIACGLGIGIAAFGGALGQGRAASAALDGIARNPGASGKIFTPMILGLALIESLVIYSLIISILLLGKI
ncbi:MAG: F0F1 ATP synthase subunit C [Myxococcales bacterium]|nr:F0F1 ATP synthase subunit C [Myxococcales bacterium]